MFTGKVSPGLYECVNTLFSAPALARRGRWSCDNSLQGTQHGFHTNKTEFDSPTKKRKAESVEKAGSGFQNVDLPRRRIGIGEYCKQEMKQGLLCGGQRTFFTPVDCQRRETSCHFMIRVIVQERTGNQLFQYAVGRHLAIKNNTSLCLDTWYYGLRRKREFSLSRFNISARLSATIPSFLFKRVCKKPLWAFASAPIYVCQRDHRFRPEVLSLPSSCTIMGGFQSEKYFKPIAGTLRRELTLKDYALTPETVAMQRRIMNTESVSVHVRRGDYVKARRYNVCTLKYYQRAVQYMRERSKKPVFYIFSDDLAHCASWFSGADIVFVDIEQSKMDSLNDLHLMSICTHNIIANSTFSWWGAWMNRNPGKLVICPNVWLNAENVPIEEKVCDGWIRMDC